MRTLKKTLSLVLVLALALGLFGVASASSFTDTKSSNYGEAVNVLSGIGVINGVTSTTFDPTGNLTREQAAKIITYLMLGSTNAALLSGVSATSYTDVAADRWSAGYIQYCTNLGILAGNGDGTFNPTGTLTSCAWAKMLLGALGYKANLEGFTGPSWAINAAAKAVKAGINDNSIALSSTASINREQASQMAFKALTATQVEYLSSGTTVTVGGATVVTGASSASSVAGTSSTSYNGASSDTATTMQFCEDHFSTLKLSTTVTTDAFGRPADTWTFGTSNTVIAQAASTPVLTYSAAFKPSDAYNSLLNSGYTIDTTSSSTSYNLVTNGTSAAVKGTDAATFFANTSAISGNGRVYEFYVDSNDKLSNIVVIDTYLAKVTSYVADTASTTTVDERTLTMTTVDGAHTLTAYAQKSASNSATTGFDSVYTSAVSGLASGNDVYVLVSFNSSDNALTIAAPTSASGTLSAYSASSSLTIGGNTYKYNVDAADKVNASFLSSSNITSAANLTVLLDSFGYVHAVKGTTSTANYAYVINASAGVFTNYAQLLLSNGSVATVETASSATAQIGQMVSYSVSTSTSKYTLTAYTGAALTAATAKNYAVYAITNGTAAMTLGAGKTVYANNNTIFLVASASSSSATGYTYKEYTGIANVPSFAAGSADSSVVSYVLNSTNASFADVVYIQAGTSAGVTTSTGTYIFKDDSSAVTDSTGTYYVYNAVINGAVTTIKLDSATAASLSAGGNAFASVTYTDGIVSATGTDFGTSTMFSGTGLKSVSNGVLGLYNGSAWAYYGYSSSAIVNYVSTSTGTPVITKSTVSGILTDSNDTYIAIKDASGIITALYVVSVA